MSDNLDGEHRHLQPRASDLRRVSRREFVGSAAALSWLGATGLPACASATAGRVNVRVSRDHYAAHIEPCLAVNPRNPQNLMAACELPETVATYVSFNGGRSWRSNGPLPLPAGSAGGGNVSAAFDEVGRGFVCGLLVSDSGQRSTYLWRSHDGGRSFTAPLELGSGPALDRPWLTTGASGSQVVHVVWSNGSSSGVATALDYARSTDGGRTFEAPRTLASVRVGLGNPVVACGPRGTVYALYGAGNGALESATDVPMTVNVICSSDGGQTFARPIEIGHGQDLIAFPGLRVRRTGPSPPARNSSLPAIAADAATGLACVVYTVHHPGAAHADVMLTISRDGGRSWTRATAVTPQDQVIYFEPQVAIDDAGRIGVMAFAMAQGMVSVVLMQSEPGSSRLGLPMAVTDQPFNAATVADPNGRLQLGEYQALATTPGAFHPVWNDPRTGKLQLYTTVVAARTDSALA